MNLDEIVKNNNLKIDNSRFYKEIKKRISDGEKFCFKSEFLYEKLPDFFYDVGPADIGICISYTKSKVPFDRTLFLFPKALTIGINFDINTTDETLENSIFEMLSENMIPLYTIENIAVTDYKKNHHGILSFCEKYHINLVSFSSEELSEIDNPLAPFSYEKLACIVTNGKVIAEKNFENRVSIAASKKNVKIEL